MEGAEKYHRQIDPEGESSVAQLLRWIRPGSKVLEMGPATGIMTQLLRENKGCDVTCVEVDPNAAERAKPFCSRMIVGDLNDTEWAREIEGEEFEYIIFADVLEHLLNPATSLQNALKYLKPHGEVLISVPNIGYVGVIADLLEGRFDYRQAGLLDATHVHFFTRKSLVQLLNQTGLISLEWRRTSLAPEVSEFRLQADQLGAATRGVLSSVPDGDTYQFLVRCSRAGIAALSVIPQSRDYAKSGLSAQVFFDRGSGFSEHDSIVLPLEDVRGRQVLHCVCPAGIKTLRFDPIDSVMPVVLHSVTVQAGGSCLYQWQEAHGALGRVSGLANAVEAHAAGCSVLIPLSNDPAVKLMVDCPTQATLTVELSCDGPQTLVNLIQGILESAENRVNRLSQEVLDRQKALQQSQASVEHLQQAKRLIEDALNGLVASKSWKLTRPLRVGVRLIRALKRLSKRLIKQAVRKAVRSGKWVVNSRVAGYLWRRVALGSEYDLRMLRIEPSPQDLVRMREESLRFAGPVFSVVMPTYKTDPLWLKQAIESVRQQAYPWWELCIADDASDDPAVRSLLSTYAASDPRVKVTFLSSNGHISKSSNVALELATGEYVVLLDHDDCLAPHALYKLAQAIAAEPSTDIIYSDEDKISFDGRRLEPTCKPAWSPDYFLSFMYTGHISCFRASLVRAVGGFRVGFEGSQDYDLMLRLTERTSNVVHIPEVLYHWRMHNQSVAGNLDSKPYAFTAAKRALVEALHRRGFPGASVADSRARGLYVVHRGERAPLGVAVALGDSSVLIESPGVTIIKHGLKGVSQLVKRLLSLNFSEDAVIALACEVSLSEGIMHRLQDHCSDKGIGVAAPIIVNRDKKVVAAGMGLFPDCMRPNFKGASPFQIGYRGRLVIPFNVSMVHPSCLLFRATLLADVPSSVETVGELVMALCVAARKRGLRCVVDPAERAILNHNLSDFDVESRYITALFAHFGLKPEDDPFLPAGLVRYEDRTEMPAI